MKVFWVIVLYNFLHQQQAVLPEQYNDPGQCAVARVAKGYANFQPFGVWGACEMRTQP